MLVTDFATKSRYGKINTVSTENFQQNPLGRITLLNHTGHTLAAPAQAYAIFVADFKHYSIFQSE
ncbi:MAG: hypothetical protein Q7T62_09955 [Undibacterium sp.]|nr:hypothetical protein [Undibacterium sp.]